jgi:hypothetical protein
MERGDPNIEPSFQVKSPPAWCLEPGDPKHPDPEGVGTVSGAAEGVGDLNVVLASCSDILALSGLEVCIN